METSGTAEGDYVDVEQYLVARRPDVPPISLGAHFDRRRHAQKHHPHYRPSSARINSLSQPKNNRGAGASREEEDDQPSTGRLHTSMSHRTSGSRGPSCGSTSGRVGGGGPRPPTPAILRSSILRPSTGKNADPKGNSPTRKPFRVTASHGIKKDEAGLQRWMRRFSMPQRGLQHDKEFTMKRKNSIIAMDRRDPPSSGGGGLNEGVTSPATTTGTMMKHHPGKKSRMLKLKEPEDPIEALYEQISAARDKRHFLGQQHQQGTTLKQAVSAAVAVERIASVTPSGESRSHSSLDEEGGVVDEGAGALRGGNPAAVRRAAESRAATLAKKRRERTVVSLANQLPSASSKGFRRHLSQRIDEYRNDPEKMRGLQVYCQENYKFIQFEKIDRSINRTTAAQEAQGQEEQQQAQHLGSFLLTQVKERDASQAGPPQRPQTAGANGGRGRGGKPNSAHDTQIALVRERKRQIDLADQQHMDEVEERWLKRWEQDDREDPSAPGQPEWRAANWASIVIAFIRAPKAVKLARKDGLKQLRSIKRSELVDLFVNKMRKILYRRRTRRAQAAWATLAACVRLMMLHKQCIVRRSSVRIVRYLCVALTKRKPVHFYLRRFYSKILMCQSAIRRHLATIRTRRLWFLICLNQHEMKVKGGYTDARALQDYPDLQRLGGKSTETIAGLCALVAGKVTSLPLDLKMHVFTSYCRHNQKKNYKALYLHRQQQQIIKKLCFNGMGYQQAKEKTQERDGVFDFPYWSIFPSAQSTKAAYERAQRKYEARLKAQFMARRSSSNYSKAMKLPKFIAETFHLGAKADARVQNTAEQELVHKTDCGWMYKMGSMMAPKNRGTAGARAKKKGGDADQIDLFMSLRLYAASIPPPVEKVRVPKPPPTRASQPTKNTPVDGSKMRDL